MRICDKCGKQKHTEGGKTCQKGHFICKECVYSGWIIVDELKYCPYDKTRLR